MSTKEFIFISLEQASKDFNNVIDLVETDKPVVIVKDSRSSYIVNKYQSNLDQLKKQSITNISKNILVKNLSVFNKLRI